MTRGEGSPRPVLAVASECAPLVKTGGLADVVGALPAALQPEGWHVRTLIPGYPVVREAVAEAASTGTAAAAEPVWVEPDLFGGPGRLVPAQVAGLDLLVLEAPHLFERQGSPYLDPQGVDWPDNDLRFAALSWTAARVAAEGLPEHGTQQGARWRPHVLHLHDWQAGLTAVYARTMGARVGIVMTIHNIAFHGLAPADRLSTLRLPAEGFHPEGFEYFGQIGALKAGLMWADRISTVSPTYAHELTTPAFGMGLEGVIRDRAAVVTGILNGIDDAVWNPATDPAILRYRTPRGKAGNRARLAEHFGLASEGGPLCVVISRLTGQKGLDLLLDALPALLDRGGSLALLGTGERELELMWRRAAQQAPGRVAVRIGYDETLAHQMFAGADAVLVPSRFEPCGLTQLYALRYGAVPVVSLTGGLADTVIHASEAALRAGVATGLQVFPIDAHRLAFALDRLCDLYADPPTWGQIQRNAMRTPVGWGASAPRYGALYAEAASSATTGGGLGP